MLEPGGYIIISCSRADHLRARIQQLQLNGEISAPLDYADFGPRHGAFAVLRRL
jgi:tryptophan synthase beta subunit